MQQNIEEGGLPGRQCEAGLPGRRSEGGRLGQQSEAGLPTQRVEDGGRPTRRIALVTPTHLARNPRIVKEADALAAAGYEVDVFYCRFMGDVVEHDRLIERRARWRAHALTYVREEAPWRFWFSRLRQHACRRAFARWRDRTPEGLTLRAFERVYPELLKMVSAHRADVYIAHNLQALPVAYHAARLHDARVGFDAEDFHTGMFLAKDRDTTARRLIVDVEGRYVRACDYVTAAAPHIAEAYADRYDMATPTTVLNTFPTAMRPDAFRHAEANAPLTLYWFSQTIGPVRGLEDAARALSLLGDVPVELHLRGKVHDPEFLRYLRALAGPAGDRILVHDLEPADEMIRLAARYDVGLALETPIELNRDLCLSNKIFSYLAAGNAVLATGTRAQSALMERIGPVGAVYPPGDARSMALRIRHWHESRALLEQCRRRAWTEASERYNWEYEQDVFLRVITGLFTDGHEDSLRPDRGGWADAHARGGDHFGWSHDPERQGDRYDADRAETRSSAA